MAPIDSSQQQRDLESIVVVETQDIGDLSQRQLATREEPKEEDALLCWICLCSSPPLIKPCPCPRAVHAECIRKWQITNRGSWKEDYCEFCYSRLPAHSHSNNALSNSRSEVTIYVDSHPPVWPYVVETIAPPQVYHGYPPTSPRMTRLPPPRQHLILPLAVRPVTPRTLPPVRPPVRPHVQIQSAASQIRSHSASGTGGGQSHVRPPAARSNSTTVANPAPPGATIEYTNCTRQRAVRIIVGSVLCPLAFFGIGVVILLLWRRF
mmetsp:Transcript_21260/g.35149  ORF Transcript_21260/g.35149 Transcript_21260/m.35149 type:complete len:265 (-) Transcript_21260:92-886(-)